MQRAAKVERVRPLTEDNPGQRDRIPQMLTRAELYELLNYAGYEERDRAYFG